MITEAHLRELLTSGEREDLDFKRQPHRLDDDDSISLFIKDILAMANTPREKTAYIIIGVGVKQDGTKTYHEVQDHPDDAMLQDKLNRAKVIHKPKFTYYTKSLDGVIYGIIEIPVDKLGGPYVASKNFGKLKSGHIYSRRGTQNYDANSNREKQKIYNWFSSINGNQNAHDKELFNRLLKAFPSDGSMNFLKTIGLSKQFSIHYMKDLDEFRMIWDDPRYKFNNLGLESLRSKLYEEIRQYLYQIDTKTYPNLNSDGFQIISSQNDDYPDKTINELNRQGDLIVEIYSQLIQTAQEML